VAKVAVSSKKVIALDAGDKRVGVAIASLQARLPSPLGTLDRADLITQLKKIIITENVAVLVVGWPRDLEGHETYQTQNTEALNIELKTLGLPVYTQDEAVTSKRAEAELESRGKPYKKADIDALAATYILEDWLAENKEVV
jgi:putative holliday junction resolvase